MTLTAGLTVLLLAPEVFWPLRRVGAEFHSARSGLTALDEAFSLTEGPDPPPSGCLALDSPAPLIRVEGLSVAGRDGMAPAALTACIRPGQITALTGDSRAGRAPLSKLLPDSNPRPRACHRRWNRRRRTRSEPLVASTVLAAAATRPHPGFSSGEPHLPGSVDDIGSACSAAGFDEVLKSLPNGLDTRLGRGGLGLSLGERQRLGLARVLGSRAPILLWTNRRPTSMSAEAAVLHAIRQRAAAGATTW